MTSCPVVVVGARQGGSVAVWTWTPCWGSSELVAPHPTEKRHRLLAGAAARALGRGGGARMARLTGLSRPTVYTGVRELDDPL